MPSRLFAGIDSGTQSTKVLVVSETGEVLGRGQETYGLIDGLPVGHKEQHPQTWIDALEKAFREAIADANADPATVAGIGVSGQQHGFVPLDESGGVIRPAKLWCDTSTAKEADEIMRFLGGPKVFQEKTGNALPAGFTASKILWLKKNEPAKFAKLDSILLPHDYLNYWLTGEKKMEWGDASGTGLMDVRMRAWSAEAIQAIDLDLMSKLPAVRPSWEVCGTVRGEAAERLGLSTSCIVSMGGGDNMMGAIGTGNVTDGCVTVSLGTSGTIYACSDKPVTDPSGEIAAFCDSTGNWLPLLCTMNVTVATELTKNLFDLDIESLNELAALAPAGAEGLMLLPYFEGERVPNVPDGTGVWFGHCARTNSPRHFARAAMEGAVLGLNYGFNRLKELGIAPSQVRVTGGGSKSKLWRQILADAFGVPVVACVESEGAALGGALQARWALERQSNPDAPIDALAREWVRLDDATRCEPDDENTALYARLQTVHDQLSLALRESFTSHRSL